MLTSGGLNRDGFHDMGVHMGKARGEKTIRVREVIRKVTKDDWKQKRRTATNHRQYKHPTKKGRVTISGNPGDEIDSDTLQSIKDQMGVTEQEWQKL